MTRQRAIVGALFVVLGGFVFWKAGHIDSNTREGGTTVAQSPAQTARPGSAIPTEAPRAAPPDRSTLADALNSPATDIRADLRLVLDIIETFRSNFLQTGNPVGTNAEITSALAGRNRLRLSLIPLDHPAINKEGELCDRWGTPFFFHAESATRMEIRSAGPDRKMWSNDDVVLSP